MFVDYRTDLVEGSSKRAGDELKQEVTKKKKVDDVQETAEVDDDQEATKIKELMEIVSDEEEVAIDAIPLATKPLTIGRIVGIKSFLMLFGITIVLIDVNAAQSKLELLENFNENYSKCLRLLVKLQLSVRRVNAASEEVSTAEFILDSDMERKNKESYKFPRAVQQSFNSLWSQDVRGDPDSGIGGLQIQESRQAIF
ncbi:hypothetical protein Tco_0358840 [Tanacetum coccineum]